jgi:hypothetical protein
LTFFLASLLEKKEIKVCAVFVTIAWYPLDQTHNGCENNLIKIKKGRSNMFKQIGYKLALAVLTVTLTRCVVDPRLALQPPQVPEALMVSATEKVSMSVLAEGVQIYQCEPDTKDATKLIWTFKAPEAVLYDKQHHEVGKHFAGPTWQAKDGSKVVGEVKARADAPSADTIPWLLLNAKATEGAGAFSHVTSIQRIETSGGHAPQDGCDSAHQDEEARVPYKAFYFFYTAQ